MTHPIFGDLDGGIAREQRRGAEAAELKRMMEDIWLSSRVVNPRRTAKYVKPMRLGSSYGYEDDIFGQ